MHIASIAMCKRSAIIYSLKNGVFSLKNGVSHCLTSHSCQISYGRLASIFESILHVTKNLRSDFKGKDLLRRIIFVRFLGH